MPEIRRDEEIPREAAVAGLILAVEQRARIGVIRRVLAFLDQLLDEAEAAVADDTERRLDA